MENRKPRVALKPTLRTALLVILVAQAVTLIEAALVWLPGYLIVHGILGGTPVRYSFIVAGATILDAFGTNLSRAFKRHPTLPPQWLDQVFNLCLAVGCLTVAALILIGV